MQIDPVVNIVDDDPAVLTSLRWLLESVDLSVNTYSCASDFLAAYDLDRPGCLVLDVRMPGLTGLDVQRRLIDLGARLPIIFMTGHGDVPTCTRAFTAGAFSFIEKPADDEQLLTQIRQAIAADLKRRQMELPRGVATVNLAELSPRELEVMDLLVGGRTQKQIAIFLGISIQTVAKHRGRVLEKLNVENDVELARLVLSMQDAYRPVLADRTAAATA